MDKYIFLVPIRLTHLSFFHYDQLTVSKTKPPDMRELASQQSHNNKYLTEDSGWPHIKEICALCWWPSYLSLSSCQVKIKMLMKYMDNRQLQANSQTLSSQRQHQLSSSINHSCLFPKLSYFPSCLFCVRNNPQINNS